MNSTDQPERKSTRFLLFNQATGVLFRQLAEDLSETMPHECLLYTGKADEVQRELPADSRLKVIDAPYYDRSSKVWKAVSWVRYTLCASFRIATARRSDYLLIVSNPPILAFCLWLITWVRNLRYGMLIYDIYPDVLVHAGILKPNNPFIRMWVAMNRRVYRKATLIVTLGPRMAKVLERQIGPTPPVHVIPPWVETRYIHRVSRSQNPLLGKLVPLDKRIVLYAGNMGTSHDIESIIKAAEQLQNRDDVYFLLVGGGEKYHWADSYVTQHKLSNVKVTPHVPESQFASLLGLADVSIATQVAGFEDIMVPSKTMFYLAAGSALLVISNRPSELTDIVDRAFIGAVVPPGNPSQLVNELLKLFTDPVALTQMQSNARALAVNQYSREQLTQRLIALLAEASEPSYEE